VILLVDNYDSFTYNLAHLFGGLGAEVIVRRNDAIDATGAARHGRGKLAPFLAPRVGGRGHVAKPGD
jgi:anthranilate/para-aminobenzoate synthase component II